MLKSEIERIENYNWKRAEEIANELEISPLVIGVLLNRNITDIDEIKNFLYGSEEPFHDPFLLKDMSKAVFRIVAAMEKGEKITVYGDYDVDGITASSLLYMFLKEQGAVVDVYIPKREDEGYGLNSDALQKLFATGTRLLITVDCGVSGNKEVAEVQKGMDIIITDHHTPPKELPAAFAIINPHQNDCRYPFKDLAGVGVAFKLCQGLYKYLTKEEELWTDKIEFAAMGTVADIVPLVGENRELVRLGLKRIKHTKSKGLLELMKVAGVDYKRVTVETIGFVIAPRLNAVGRLEHAMSAVDLLTTDDNTKAEEIAQKLNEENILRQSISKKIFEEAEEMLHKADSIKTAIVLAKEDWHAGVVGIVASRLVDKYNLPTVLITMDGEKAKGSCRSIPPLNIYEALEGCKEFLLQFGGHNQAAGLTLTKDNIPKFKTAFAAKVKEMMPLGDYIPTVTPDYFVPFDKKITVKTINDLTLLEPCGAANPFPIFAFADATLTNFYTIGREKNHMKLFVNYSGIQYKAIIWNEGEHFSHYYAGQRGDVAFVPKYNVFQGIESVDLHLLAIKPFRNIIDMRNGKESKRYTLKNILQTGEKTVIYVSDKNDFAQVSVKGNCHVFTYEQKLLDSGIKNVVFYDLPPIGLLDSLALLLSGRTDVALYLLYNNEDLLKRELELRKAYPDKNIMRVNYKYLINLIKSQSVVKIDSLLDHAKTKDCFFTIRILTVFAELNFIDIVKEQITFKSSKHNELLNSQTYSHMCEEYKEKKQILKSTMSTSALEIMNNWK